MEILFLQYYNSQPLKKCLKYASQGEYVISKKEMKQVNIGDKKKNKNEYYLDKEMKNQNKKRGKRKKEVSKIKKITKISCKWNKRKRIFEVNGHR